MRPYVITSGVLFSLLTIAHIVRVAAEGVVVLTDSFFALSTVVATSMAVWAVWIIATNRRRTATNTS